MNLSDLRDHLRRKADDIQQYLEGDAKHIVGQMAVDHFRKSFDDQGYTDELLNPWQEVERRKPESPWYGHSGETGCYSPERTRAPILTGETGELKEAIRYAPIPGGVRVSNEKPYAHIHNYGGPAKVYGKTPFVMPRRQFMGPAKALTRRLKERITRDLTHILSDKQRRLSTPTSSITSVRSALGYRHSTSIPVSSRAEEHSGSLPLPTPPYSSTYVSTPCPTSLESEAGSRLLTAGDVWIHHHLPHCLC